MGGVERMQSKWSDIERAFCTAYLKTLDPERAAAACRLDDGFALLVRKSVRKRLESMRTAAAEEIRREDVLRRLAQLAFGRANDAAKLALSPGNVDPAELDLSAVSEIKVTDKSVEIKLVDRVRALETLCGLLGDTSGGAEELYQALAEAAGQIGEAGHEQ